MVQSPSTSTTELYARARAMVPVKVRLASGVIRFRSPAKTVGLTVATFGLYGLFWLHRISRELKRTTDHPDVRPTRDLVWIVLTFGLYGIVVLHRNARMIHAVSVYFDRSHPDRSGEALTFALGGLFSAGLLGLFAVHAVQSQMNQLGDLAESRARERTKREERSSERFLVSRV